MSAVETGEAGDPRHATRSGGLEAVDALLAVLAIFRRRWLAVGLCTFAATLGAFAVLSLLRPRWRATASVVVHASGARVLDDVKGLADEDLGGAAYKQYFETQKAIISSRRVAAAALEELGLAQDPVFLGIDSIESEGERRERAAKIDPVDRLREMVTVQDVRDSRVVKISAEYPDAEVARDIANAVAHAYVGYVDRSRSTTSEEAGDKLGLELRMSLAALREAELALDRFKAEHEITTISLEDRQSLITQNILLLSARTKEAQAERISQSAVYEQARKLHAGGSLAAVNLLPASERLLLDSLLAARVEADRDLSSASVTHGERMPDVQRAKQRLAAIDSKITHEGEALIGVMRARSAAARKAELELAAALESERQRALELARLEPEFRDLARRVRETEADYDRLARRDSELGITQRVEPKPPVEILDEATVPSNPAFPNKLLILAMGLLVGLSIGAVVAIAVDARDLRIRSTSDLERALAGLAVPVLSQLPVLPADPRLGAGNVRAQRRQRDLHTHLFPQSLMAERCRVLRTAVTFALSPERGKPVSIMVTSPSSGEGKSSTAINLAVSFCQSGKRVALIDGDMRRPRLHHVFPQDVGKEALGLAGLLTGKLMLDDALIHGREEMPETLSVLPCGEIPANPAELLDRPSFRKLLADLRERFDIIVFDTPPVLPVTDPLMIAREVDGVVLVARCGATQRSDVLAALGELRRSETHMLGTVLNVVDPRSESRGYAAGAYYYEYSARTARPRASEGA